MISLSCPLRNSLDIIQRPVFILHRHNAATVRTLRSLIDIERRAAFRAGNGLNRIPIRAFCLYTCLPAQIPLVLHKLLLRFAAGDDPRLSFLTAIGFPRIKDLIIYEAGHEPHYDMIKPLLLIEARKLNFKHGDPFGTGDNVASSLFRKLPLVLVVETVRQIRSEALQIPLMPCILKL